MIEIDERRIRLMRNIETFKARIWYVSFEELAMTGLNKRNSFLGLSLFLDELSGDSIHVS